MEVCRHRACEETARLPGRLLTLDPAEPPYPVVISPGLAAERDRVARHLSPERD